MSDRPQDPPIVPAEYGGKWLAWSIDGLQILGVGDSPEQAEADAQCKSSGETISVILEWVPPAEEALIAGGG